MANEKSGEQTNSEANAQADSGYVATAMPVTKPTIVFALLFIVLLIVGGLMIGGFLSADPRAPASQGGESERAKP